MSDEPVDEGRSLTRRHEPTPISVSLLGPPPIGLAGYEFAPGRVTVVYGQNGAGKTRLLRAIADAVRGASAEGTVALFQLIVPNDQIRRISDNTGSMEDFGARPKQETWSRKAMRTFGEGGLLSAVISRGRAQVGDHGQVGVVLLPRADPPPGVGPGWSAYASPVAPPPTDFQGLGHVDLEVLELTIVDDLPEPFCWVDGGDYHAPVAWVTDDHPPVRVIDLDQPQDVDTATAAALPDAYVEDESGTWTRSQAFSEAVKAVEAKASRLYGLLGPTPVPLRLDIPSPDRMFRGESPSWRTPSQVGWDIPLAELSFAQRRWAEAAILLALTEFDDRYTLILADEPEAGLHRTAAARQPAGILRALDELGGRVEFLLTSHSPYLMAEERVRLLHARRTPAGWATIAPTELDVTGGVATDVALDLLGLLHRDLWELTKVFVFVEGPHDAEVLRAFLGDVLNDSRARLVPLGGATQASAIAADVYVSMTDVPLVVVFDQVSDAHLTHWYAAVDALAEDDTERCDAELSALKSKAKDRGSTEVIGLANLALAARSKGFPLGRIHVVGLSEPDIVCYLPVEFFVEGAESWRTLLGKAATNPKNRVKEMRKGREITTDEVALAAERVRGSQPPPDLQALGRVIADLVAHEPAQQVGE